MKKNSKDGIVDAAIFLFNTKGFAATTIRDIAQKAKINISNISYYFQNKNGLLEYCFTKYFEAYLTEIEAVLNDNQLTAKETLKSIAERIIYFNSTNIQLTRVILREMSIDSQVVREIMSTYIAKETYYFQSVLEQGMSTGEFRTMSMPYVMIQFKSQLSMPFLNSHYLAEVLHVFAQEPYFIRKYLEEVNRWIDYSLCRESKVSSLNPSIVASYI